MKLKTFSLASLALSVISMTSGISIPLKKGSADELTQFTTISEQVTSFNKNKVFNDFHAAFPNETSQQREISEIKELHDFAENKYFVVEFLPMGYMIYDSDFSMTIEANADAQSPYAGLNKNLIYAGAMNYYIQSSSTNEDLFQYEHTVRDEEIVVNEAELDILKKYSNKLAKNISEEIQLTAINTTSTEGPQQAELTNSTFIKNLNTSDFNNDGRCVWVASAIIVYYHKIVWGWSNLAPNGFNRGLTNEIRGDRDIAATLSDARWALKDYVKTLGGINDGYAPMDTIYPKDSTIYERVASNIPVIIGSTNMPRPGNNETMSHAVVVHKVERTATKNWLGTKYSDYKYWTHFGWGPGYNNVMLSASSFTIDSRCNFQN